MLDLSLAIARKAKIMCHLRLATGVWSGTCKIRKKIPKNNTFLPTKSPLSSCIYAWLLVWHLPEEPEVFASLDWQLPLESGTCQKILKPFFTQDRQLKMCQEMGGGGVRLNSAFLYWVLMFLWPSERLNLIIIIY